MLLLLACNDPIPQDSSSGKDSSPEHIPGDTADTDGTTTDTVVDTETGTTETDTETDTDTDTTTDTDTDTTSAYDCDNLPPTPLEQTELDKPRGYHDLLFDDDGNIIGWNAGNLITATMDASSILIPGITEAQGMDRLFDGDFVYVGAGSVVRFKTDGSRETITTDMNGAYGLTVGPDGNIYVANYQGVWRVETETGEKTELFRMPGYNTAHTIAFNLDSTEMYVGIIGSGGRVYAQPLDENLDPSGDMYVYAEDVGMGYHDGLGVDVCGNLYVADYSSSGFYRVLTDGTVEELVPPNGMKYGHGLEWGYGIGDFRDDALYQPQPYDSNTVREVVIGIENGNKVRTWKGEAIPYYTP